MKCYNTNDLNDNNFKRVIVNSDVFDNAFRIKDLAKSTTLALKMIFCVRITREPCVGMCCSCW